MRWRMGRISGRRVRRRSAAATLRCCWPVGFARRWQRLNPHLPAETLEDVLRKVRQAETPSLVEENRRLHRYLVEGVPVEVAREDGSVGGDTARLIDFDRRRFQRLARGQPVHGDRGPEQPPARCGAVRERAAARRDRAEEPRRRKRHARRRVQPAPERTRTTSLPCSAPTPRS